MNGGDKLVPRASAVYREFARLYRVTREMRPTSVDRWNGDLYATGTRRWGGFDPKTGSIRLSGDRVLRHLTGSTSQTDPRRQAQALATVLHESTHAGMETDAPAEPNAVRSLHSQGAMEGVAELRALNDFVAFSVNAGYPGLTPPSPARPGAYAAMDSLVTQASGPAKGRYALIAEAVHGPGVMHFDQLADGVVQNRLAEVVPDRAEDRLAVRAALIPTMTHNHWPTLPDASAETGGAVAEDIRRSLNAKVDEIRRHYQANPNQPFPADFPNAAAVRPTATQVGSEVAQSNERVLGRADREGLARPPRATPGRQTSRPVGRNDPARTRPADSRPATASPTRSSGHQQTQSPNPALAGGQRPAEMRFLDGQAPASQATKGPPSLGDGSRGAGAPQVPAATRSFQQRPGPTDRGRD
jgi:hypothetical protein